MAHLDDSSNDIWDSTTDGKEWQRNRRTYTGQSRATPAMAALAGKFYMVHIGGSSNQILHTLYDTSLPTIVAPVGVTYGLENHLNAGDAQTVALAYS
jgi:hypothetical protein